MFVFVFLFKDHGKGGGLRHGVEDIFRIKFMKFCFQLFFQANQERELKLPNRQQVKNH